MDTSKYGLEDRRLSFLINRDGISGALQFAKQTKDIYRKYVVSGRVPRELRGHFIGSYLAFKRFISDHEK